MAKRRKTGGRQRGTPNRTTVEARTFCASVVDDPTYQKALKRRALSGRLAPAVECMVWHYAKGRPTEETKLTIDTPLALRIELTDAHAPPSRSEPGL